MGNRREFTDSGMCTQSTNMVVDFGLNSIPNCYSPCCGLLMPVLISAFVLLQQIML